MYLLGLLRVSRAICPPSYSSGHVAQVAQLVVFSNCTRAGRPAGWLARLPAHPPLCLARPAGSARPPCLAPRPRACLYVVLLPVLEYFGRLHLLIIPASSRSILGRPHLNTPQYSQYETLVTTPEYAEYFRVC